MGKIWNEINFIGYRNYITDKKLLFKIGIKHIARLNYQEKEERIEKRRKR